MNTIEKRKIRIRFCNRRDQRKIINAMSAYDDSKTFYDNCVGFLNEMEKQERLEELAKIMED